MSLSTLHTIAFLSVWSVLDDGRPHAQTPDAPASTAQEAEAARSEPVADQPLETYRRELLDIAFRSASAFPLDPHIKNRSRAQEKVVAACFELDQPIRALDCIGKIENWRRGVGYADFAAYCVEHGDTAELQSYLDLALEVAASDDEELQQEWRADRIRAKVARTLYSLGQEEAASRLVSDLTESEQVLVISARAAQLSPEVCDAQIAKLDLGHESFAVLGLDQVRNVLGSLSTLYERFYLDAERRARLEQKIEAIPWDTVPEGLQIEFLSDLAGVAIDHDDEARALELVKEAQAVRAGTRWSPEDEVEIAARLAALRFRAGDAVRAKSELDAARALFEAQREKIQTMFRAGALRSVAEAYHAIGDTRTALAIYRIAVDDGAENPNARPRAEDLSETCISMALRGVEPDERLWTRLRQIQDGLRDPW